MSILELTRVRNELAASDDLLRQAIDALRLILPMARNYSAKNINKTAVKHLDAASAVLTAYDKREQS